MSWNRSRRDFLRDLGVGAAAIPFAMNLPSLAMANEPARKKRLVIIFSPNGVIPDAFWPDETGSEFTLKESLTPLESLKDRTLILHGVCDKIRGDGDGHMRGIGCLLTGIELFPGNIQGGSDTPAGWSSGPSIDQVIKKHLQKAPATRTRFGSLEFGVMVPNRADTWTRMVYEGPNRPVAPINSPQQMFNKLYGRLKDQESLKSILDDLQDDLKKLESAVGAEDRRILAEHASFVREMELELKNGAVSASTGAAPETADVGHAVPEIDPMLREENDQIPQISKAHIDLMVQSFVADFTRVATLQYTNAVGMAKMNWIGVSEGHHELSHHPDNNLETVEKLTKINKWFCEQVAYLAQRLADTPEPEGDGSLLDNTTIIWTNELGKGNTHTMNNIPFVLVGDGLDFKMGQSLKLPMIAHNRLLMSIGQGMGLEDMKTFGNPDFCADGPLTGLT